MLVRSPDASNHVLSSATLQRGYANPDEFSSAGGSRWLHVRQELHRLHATSVHQNSKALLINDPHPKGGRSRLPTLLADRHWRVCRKLRSPDSFSRRDHSMADHLSESTDRNPSHPQFVPNAIVFDAGLPRVVRLLLATSRPKNRGQNNKPACLPACHLREFA